MKKWLVVASSFFAFSVIVATPAFAEVRQSTASSNAVADKLIDDVITLSGIKESLQNLPEQIGEGIRISAFNSPTPVPQDVLSEIQNAAMQAYSSDAFIEEVESALKANWDEKRLKEVLATLSTPLSRRMTALESKEPAPAELSAFISKLATQPLPPARLALLKQLDEISRSSEFAVKMLTSTMHSLTLGFTRGCGDSLNAFNKKFSSQRAQFEENTRNSIRAQMAYTYRDVSDADLQKYIKALDKQSSRWFNNIVFGAIDKAFNTSAEQLGRSLQETFKRKGGGTKEGGVIGCQEA